MSGEPLPDWIAYLTEHDRGQIGDVFGGLLGPALNALVLGTTVWFAWTEARRSVADRQEDQRLMRERAATERAEKVVAWVAETERDAEGQQHRGVVIVNGSDTLVRDLDVVIAVDSQDDADDAREGSSAGPASIRTTTLLNRESLVPPGTWFLQMPSSADAEDKEDAEGTEPEGREQEGWPAPFAVDVSSGELRVRLPGADISAPGAEPFLLKVHARERVGGRLQDYHSVALLRYEIHGGAWWRDADGSLTRERPSDERYDKLQLPTDDTWDAHFTELAIAPRPEPHRPTRTHAKNPAAKAFISQLTKVLDGYRAAGELGAVDRVRPSHQTAYLLTKIPAHDPPADAREDAPARWAHYYVALSASAPYVLRYTSEAGSTRDLTGRWPRRQVSDWLNRYRENADEAVGELAMLIRDTIRQHAETLRADS